MTLLANLDEIIRDPRSHDPRALRSGTLPCPGRKQP
jgi:hypothetical protein